MCYDVHLQRLKKNVPFSLTSAHQDFALKNYLVVSDFSFFLKPVWTTKLPPLKNILFSSLLFSSLLLSSPLLSSPLLSSPLLSSPLLSSPLFSSLLFSSLSLFSSFSMATTVNTGSVSSLRALSARVHLARSSLDSTVQVYLRTARATLNKVGLYLRWRWSGV